jgi:alkanesulfonate monooxygenase SsuD/methylene tetrahydromethanopterin reductase-like flavin-dependent oxidoreductase (luciferase family)
MFLVGVGPITVQRGTLEPRGDEQLWADAIAGAGLAEELGFDSVWVGEHHFTTDGYLSAVFPMLAAIAATTERVALGTKVLLAPLHHPLRIAEDAAAVQAISRGRLILGSAIGYREEEFAGFGIPRAERVARLCAAIETCRAAWDGTSATVVRPRVAPIPVWLGGAAPAALHRAGALADGFVAPVGPVEDLREQLIAVDDAAAAAGRAAPPVASSSFVLLRHPDLDPRAQQAGLEQLLDGYQNYKADDPRSRVGRRSESEPMVIDGDAEQVTARLLEFRRATAVDRLHHHVVRLEFPGMDLDQVSATLTAFARDVLPKVRA